jgi:hypothetical protein
MYNAILEFKGEQIKKIKIKNEKEKERKKRKKK